MTKPSNFKSNYTIFVYIFWEKLWYIQNKFFLSYVERVELLKELYHP